jgi:uncharacterized protein (UPF0335 family)
VPIIVDGHYARAAHRALSTHSASGPGGLRRRLTIKGLNEGKKEAFAEAKGEGLDVKVLREILRLRKLDREDREEHESLVDLYLRAMESASTPDVRAA